MPSKKYWNDRYNNNDIGWDIGKVSHPIKQWLDHESDFLKKILTLRLSDMSSFLFR